MVDFQSRDTRRGLDDDSDADAEEDAAASTPEESDATGASAGGDATAGSAIDPHEDPTVAVLETAGATSEASGAVTTALESAGYAVLGGERRLRDRESIRAAVDEYAPRRDVCAVVTVGGTGVGPSEGAVEAVRPLIDVALPGFGEWFRRECEPTGPPGTVASRVVAGIADDTPVFCVPGDEGAATFAVREKIAPEAAAIHREAAGR